MNTYPWLGIIIKETETNCNKPIYIYIISSEDEKDLIKLIITF